jgi:aryl-alcohol dehydrogenase-like predicted oxidoreductase
MSTSSSRPLALTDYRTLGRSGLRVSPYCLGAWTFGEDSGFGSSVEVSEQIIETYLRAGGNFIDTANMYNRGHSEKIIGDLLARHPGRRDGVVIATKFFGNLFPGNPNGGGAGRKSMLAACNESLRRLRTEYIDLYWVHSWDRHTPIEETLLAMNDLVRAGKVRYLGLSDHPAWKTAQAQTLAQLRGWNPLIALQIEYSLAERTVESELVPMALEFALGITPWSPLKSGLLTGKYPRANGANTKSDRAQFMTGAFTDRNFDIVDTLVAIGRELGATPASVALAWLAQRPGVSSIILGARNLEQLAQNLTVSTLSLPTEAIARLDTISRPPVDFVSYCNAINPAFMHGGMSVNGLYPPAPPSAPAPEQKVY